MIKKIQELNNQLLESGDKGISLNPSAISTLSASLKTLEKSLAPSASASSQIDDPSYESAVSTAIHISTQWPTASRVPGLDLYRLLAAVSSYSITTQDPMEVLEAASALSPKSNPTNAPIAMLALRFYANMFAHSPGRAYARSHMSAIVSSTTRAMTAFLSNRNVLAAAMTLAINYAVLLTTEGTEGVDDCVPLVEAVLKVLGAKGVVDSEVLYRGLVALGTFMSVEQVRKGVEAARIRDAVSRVEKVSREPRIVGVCGEVRTLV